MSDETHFFNETGSIVSGGPFGPKEEPCVLPNRLKNLTKLFILVFICQPFGAGTLSFVSGGPFGPKEEPSSLLNHLKI